VSNIRHVKVSANENAALLRLLDVATGDSGQSRRVADFLLAWWSPGSCGGFDLTVAWALDEEIVADLVTVFGLAARSREYPDALGYGEAFRRVVQAWRPELKDRVRRLSPRPTGVPEEMRDGE
jgi:hypothetical protein